MNAPSRYLHLPTAYAESLGGLRWSASDNVLEHRDGACFLFTEQIAEFLEGFGSVRPLVHFAFMAHMLAILRQVPPLGAADERVRLWRSFLDTGRNLRHAGAFCAKVCEKLPDAVDAGRQEEICRHLRGHLRVIHWSVTAAEGVAGEPLGEAPPLQHHEFHGYFLAALCNYSAEETTAWLRHGRASVEDAAEALAQAFPASLAGRLAQLLDRPRLSGAQAFLKQLTGALTLPPRRLAQQELPLGGYADVTTRGNVDQILPSQFALDDWDFFRRYAERELLYFRREEPNSPSPLELLVLLDQGVRTWGDVRIVLTAALLAFGKQAIRRKARFFIATTSGAQVVDPLDVDAEELGQIVEAADLSHHPGAALERVLEGPSPGDRDIVLLTHPRSLHEAELSAAARRVRPGTRLFALTLDRHGAALLGEIKRGVTVPVREFRVDFAPARELPPATVPVRQQEPRAWQGDLEPIPFPFRFGVGGAIGPRCFAFDASDRLLLTASGPGMLHLWNADGSLVEILPRGMYEVGTVVNSVDAVLGVAGGFVVVGKLSGGLFVFLHYDLECRKCNVYRGAAGGQWTWQYSPQHHCFIACNGNPEIGFAIDLGTGDKFRTDEDVPTTRAGRAWEAWVAGGVAPQRLGEYHGKPLLAPRVDPKKGEVEVACWKFTPLADGKPMLANNVLVDAQRKGKIVALETVRSGTAPPLMLRLFRVPEGIFLGEYGMPPKHPGFTLSGDGQFLARQLNEAVLEISHVAGSIAPLGRTKEGGFPQQLTFELSRHILRLITGQHSVLLDWSSGELLCKRNRTASMGPMGPNAKPGAPRFLGYDTQRWLSSRENTGLIAASDRYGQVAMFDREGKLICMFFAFRNRVAGWMPDGTRFGPASWTGHAPSRDAAKKFGAALWFASKHPGRGAGGSA